MKASSKNVVRGALILTIAGLISKVLSATYRIPLQNLTGDVGFYLYQQVYPFIGTVMILALYGFPVAVSKLVADSQEKQQSLTWNHFYFPLLTILFMINGSLFLLIFITAPLMAQLSGDSAFASVYRAVSFLFLFVPFIALARGSFQGIGEMKQTAYSQVIEQIVRVTIIIIAAYAVFIGKMDVENIALAGVLATMIGMVIVTLFLIVLFRKRKLSMHAQLPIRSIPWRYFFYTCITLGIVASLNQLILILIQLTDVLTLVPNLMEYGLTLEEAREWKGVFDRGQPLIQFGVVFGSSFALALIPAMSQTKDKSSLHRNEQTIQDAISLSFYLALGATVGLICILPEANLLLFMDQAGTFSLQILVVSILLTSMSITASAILLSQGNLKQIVFAIVIMFLAKYVLNELLVPMLNITGSAIATMISLAIFMILVYRQLKGIHWVRSIRIPACLIATLGMSAYLIVIKWMIYPLFDLSRIGLFVYVIFIVTTGAMIYLILLLRYGAFSIRQMNNLPLSSVLLRLNEKMQRKH